MRRDHRCDFWNPRRNFMSRLCRLNFSTRLCNLSLNLDAARPSARLLEPTAQLYVQTLQTQLLDATMQFESKFGCGATIGATFGTHGAILCLNFPDSNSRRDYVVWFWILTHFRDQSRDRATCQSRFQFGREVGKKMFLGSTVSALIWKSRHLIWKSRYFCIVLESRDGSALFWIFEPSLPCSGKLRRFRLGRESRAVSALVRKTGIVKF